MSPGPAFHEHEAGGERGALVAIHEGMVAAEIEEIGRRDLDRVRHHGYAAIGRLRRGDRRLQERSLTYPRATAMRG
jgi:hypothetical protein